MWVTPKIHLPDRRSPKGGPPVALGTPWEASVSSASRELWLPPLPS